MSLKVYCRQQLSVMYKQFGASAFNTVVCWRKLGEVENECTSRKPIVCAIRVPKMVKFGTHLTNLWQKPFCTVFLRHGVHCSVHCRLISAELKQLKRLLGRFCLVWATRIATHIDSFVNPQRILKKDISLAHSVKNLQWSDRQISHHTVTASLHYLVKYRCEKN